MRYLTALLAFLVLSITLVSTAPASAPTLDGKWRFSGNNSEVEQMHNSVDAGIADMNFVFRGIAKRVLRGECKPWKSVQIERNADMVTVIYDGDALQSPLGKTIVTKTKKGERMQVFREIRGDKLYEKLWTDEGGRSNTYRRTSNGLHVSSQIFSEKLPAPIKFNYSYR